jgi:beta-lactamase regulating signal transducer with metallopeptidase domain
MLPVIVEAAIRSLLLAAVVWIALRSLRIANPHIEMAVWQIVLAGSLAMPFVGGLRAIPLPAANLPTQEIQQLHHALSFDPPLLLAPSRGPMWPHLEAPLIDWREVFLAIYLFVAAILILRLLIGIALAWKLCRSAVRVREDWTAGHDVRTSAAIRAPASFASTILVPADYPRWDATQRAAVMAHEGWHVRHGDFYLLTLAAINRAAFWFSPLAWWLHSRIGSLAEARSDAAAIKGIEDRVRYAEILVGFGAGAGPRTVGLAMAGTNTVSRRVERILAEAILPRTMNWKIWLLVAAAVVPLAAIAAGAFAQAPSQTQAQPSSALAPETIAARKQEQNAPREQVPIDPSILDNYVGYYQFDQYAIFTVKRLGDQLFVQLTGQQTFQVFPESAQKFFYKVVHAQISFVTDAQGHTTELILHQSGLERPANRIDEAQARAVEDSLAKRIKDGTPMPGSEAALRHQINALLHGHMDSREMTEDLAAVTRPQMTNIEQHFGLLGPLQSLSFAGVSTRGWDMYDCKFANGTSVCRILLAPDGKVGGLLFQW